MSVVQLEDMKAYLGLTDVGINTKLQAEIDASEAAIADRCGPLAVEEKTERVAGGVPILWLPVNPVVSLVSVTPSYSASVLTLTDLYLDTRLGTVEQNSGAMFAARYYTVVYNAGRATCPDDLIKAVKELTRFNWQSSQRSATGRSGTTRSDQIANTVPGANREFPFEVERVVARHAQVIA